MKKKLSFLSTAMDSIFSEIETMTKEEALAVNRAAVARINSCAREVSRAAAAKFNIGDRVRFYTQRMMDRITGVVDRVNERSIGVVEETPVKGRKWRVAPSLLEKA